MIVNINRFNGLLVVTYVIRAIKIDLHDGGTWMSKSVMREINC